MWSSSFSLSNLYDLLSTGINRTSYERSDQNPKTRYTCGCHETTKTPTIMNSPLKLFDKGTEAFVKVYPIMKILNLKSWVSAFG